MPRLCHIVEQILAKLRKAEVALSKGQPVAQACRTLGITEQAYYPAAVPGQARFFWEVLRLVRSSSCRSGELSESHREGPVRCHDLNV